MIILVLVLVAAQISASFDVNITNQVYFDLEIDQIHIGRVIFGLFGEIAPITVENFRGLCTGEYGLNGDGLPLHYKNSVIHRIFPNFAIQGGDITIGDGSGGESIYGRRFRDEPFTLQHSQAGFLSMANYGKNSNNSQFYILFAQASWLDGKSVVFGKVIEGFSILETLEKHGNAQGKVNALIRISDSGELISL